MSTSPPREHENRKILGISPAPATNFCRADPIRESPGSTRGLKAPERPPFPSIIAAPAKNPADGVSLRKRNYAEPEPKPLCWARSSLVLTLRP